MRQTLNSISTLILKLTLPITAFLTPLFFIPNTTDFFTINKQLLILTIASFALFAWTVRLITRKELQITLSPALIPLLGLSFIYVLSAILQSPNTGNALLARPSTIIALTIIFITTTSTLKRPSHINITLSALILSLTIASVAVIYQFTGFAESISTATWLNNKVFNPVGGPLPFLTLSIPLIPTGIYIALKTKSPAKKLAHFIAISIMIVASIMAISLLLPQNGQPQVILLPHYAGWVIAVDILKQLRTALIGTGPGTFLSTFSQLKPAFLNQTIFWNTYFSSSSNEYLHLLTTTGILGLLFYLSAHLKILIKAFKVKLTTQHSSLASLRLLFALLLLAQIAVPASIPLLTITFVVLSLIIINLKNLPNSPIRSTTLSFATGRKEKGAELLPWIIFIPSLALILVHGYFRFNAYASELTFYQSLQAAAANQGTQTYNLQIKTIEQNPTEPRFRVSYSQTNLALANSIAGKGNLSDQDRSNVTQLIQQAIREAKSATVLAPNNPTTWTNLANIYRQLINLAQGADQWAVAAYTQAIALDPLNPQLRLDLGGVYYSLGNYDQAIRLFTQATEAKSNWANAYYNLSAAYRDDNRPNQALQAMRVVVQLVDPTSTDYQKAQNELSALEQQVNSAQLQDTQPNQGTPSEPELQTPTPIPSPTIDPIELPDGSGIDAPPPEEEPTPTPTPEQ